ncbi:hypothetical protein [Streptomyces sp. NPDC088816]|uniref:TRADD-N-associated membrane domain-containing protein n=1 Tax=Streptomyces sp. NPDC088816 TaxID=3365906 RepID=UPI00380BC615
MNWMEVLLAVLSVVGGLGATAGLQWVQSQLFDRAVGALRRRLQVEVLGESPDAEPNSPRFWIFGGDKTSTAPSPEAEPEADNAAEGPTQPKTGTTGSQRVLANQQFATLLIEYYAYGLTQARRSFGVSLSCSTLGGLILLAGIAMAIFKADGTGDQYASVTASVAGLLMTVIGTLFHRRADQALKHMESQTQSLRQDMNVERDAGQAVRLLEDVEDPALKAHLQAALILKFSAAELPKLGGVLKSVDSESALGSNGALPQQQSESPSS